MAHSPEDLYFILEAHCPHKPRCTEMCEEADESYEQEMWEMAN